MNKAIVIKILSSILLSSQVFSFRVSAEVLKPGVDLRDLVAYKSKSTDENAKVARAMMALLEKNTCQFVAPLHNSGHNLSPCNPKIKYSVGGALGPEGETSGKNFKINSKQLNLSTRTNTILSIVFDRDVGFKNSSKDVLGFTVTLFIHDKAQYESSDHYYFRKIDLSYSYKLDQIISPEGQIASPQDIPLKDTQFSFFTDITQRKTILYDSKNKITQVIPVGVGALDVRTFEGMDNFVGSMTLELKNNAHIFYRQGVGLHRARTLPWYYKGRPFLGILDNNGSEYKEIGYHYKIDDGPLVRGFVTHGCIRVRDQDLYQMEAIVFSGKKEVPVKVVNAFSKDEQLNLFENLDHPYPKTDVGFSFLNYAKKDYLNDNKLAEVKPNIGRLANSSRFSEVEQYVWCRQNGLAQPIRYFGNWASALDNYCLTKIAHSNQNVIPFLQFILGDPEADAFIEPLEPAEPILIQGLCKNDVSMAKAVNTYINAKNKELTFGVYVDHCGCKRFKQELGSKLFQSSDGKVLTSKQVYKKYCGSD